MTPLARTIAGLTVGRITSGVIGLAARLQTGHTAAATKKLTSRRSFTRNAALGASLIVTAEIAVGTVYLLWPNKTGAFGGEITISGDSVPPVEGAPYRHAQGKFYIVHTEEGIQALYWKCVHLGCTVPWITNRHEFVCPCHGSVYAYNGSRISGPASRALDAMPVTVNDNGSVTVDTNPNGLIVREAFTPEDAVPFSR